MTKIRTSADFTLIFAGWRPLNVQDSAVERAGRDLYVVSTGKKRKNSRPRFFLRSWPANAISMYICVSLLHYERQFIGTAMDFMFCSSSDDIAPFFTAESRRFSARGITTQQNIPQQISFLCSVEVCSRR